MRRFGDQKQSGRSYRRRPGAYAVITGQRGVLLTHQQAPAPEFQLPGGGIDPGETPVQALYRETLEETGWIIHSPRFLGRYKRYVYMPEYELFALKICHIYHAFAGRKRSLPTEPGHSAHWVPPVEAIGLVESTGDAAALAEFFNLTT